MNHGATPCQGYDKPFQLLCVFNLIFDFFLIIPFRVPYLALARTFEEIEAVSARLVYTYIRNLKYSDLHLYQNVG